MILRCYDFRIFVSSLFAGVGKMQTMEKREQKKALANGGFGTRLAGIRKQRGLTQEELGRAVGVSKRVIAYYEAESPYPPIHLTGSLVEALQVTADELLGVKPQKREFSPEELSLWRRFKKVRRLSLRDQKTVYSLIRALVMRREASRPQP